VITEIYLQHFKCFEEIRLELAPLTALTGWNSSGKSTIIQGLVLLDQTMTEMASSRKLKLNGRQISLGAFNDLQNQISGRGEVKVSISVAEKKYIWHITRDDKALHLPDIKEMRVVTSGVENVSIGQEKLFRLLPDTENVDADRKALSGLVYLSADRVAAREAYAGFRDSYDDSDADKPIVGSRGEYALALLSERQRDPVSGRLIIAPDAPTTVLGQAEAWLAKLFRDAGIALRPVEGTNLVSMGVRSSKNTNYLRPQNVGYGLTQALPIVVMGLCAKPGHTLLIENPEVHLHPSAQSGMGAFLARVAASGVQVILESHSDHILNGVRRAVKEEILSSDQTAVYFFGGASAGAVEQIRISKEGKLSAWPPGFFDQSDEDLAFITGM
jgi:predicted ATPase